MISVDSLLYKIDQRLNKLSTNEHQRIQLEDKILALNEAQIKLIKQKLDGTTADGLGLDSFKKRYEDLQKLVEPYEDHVLPLILEDANLKANVNYYENLINTSILQLTKIKIGNHDY
jgi:DNA repair ATPase RecN